MGHFVLVAFIFVSVWIMANSLIHLLRIDRSEYLIFSWQHFLILLYVYFVFIFGFAIVYLGLGVAGYTSILIHDLPKDNYSVKYIGNIIYFSAMTMVTVGYGDITPLGFAKLLASIQALVGYLLPAAFIVSGFSSSIESRKGG